MVSSSDSKLDGGRPEMFDKNYHNHRESVSGRGGENAPENTQCMRKNDRLWRCRAVGVRAPPRQAHRRSGGSQVFRPRPRGRTRRSPGERGGAIEAAKQGVPDYFWITLRTRTERGRARGPAPPGARSRESWFRRFGAGGRARGGAGGARGGREWAKSRITWRSAETCLSNSRRAPN